MNRKERRHMERQLGITKHKQQKSMKDRLKNLQENIEAGKKRAFENDENRKRQENEAADKAAHHEMTTLATTLMIQNSLSWSDALKAAKQEIEYREMEKKEAQEEDLT